MANSATRTPPFSIGNIIAYQETPSGTINGSNTAFTLANTPADVKTVRITLDGVVQRNGAGLDFTVSGTTITFVTAPATGSEMFAYYLTLSGGLYVDTNSAQIVQNKDIRKRVITVNAPGATPATNLDTTDIADFTGLATAITSMTTNLTGSVYEGMMREWQFTDNGTARAITWGASFANGGLVNLPTTTVLGVMLRVLTQYSAVRGKHECIAVS